MATQQDSLAARFAREVEHFDRVYADQARSDDLRLSPRDLARYADPAADTAYGKDRWFCDYIGEERRLDDPMQTPTYWLRSEDPRSAGPTGDVPPP